MRIKKTLKPGVCYANRCTATENLADREAMLFCPKHIDQPIEAAAPAAPAGGELVPVAVKAEVVAPIEAEALRFQQALSAPVVNDDASLKACGELAAYLQKRKRETEAQRKSVTTHLVKAKREIDAWFKPAICAFDEALKAVHGAISDYQMRCAAERAKALEAGDHSTAMAVPQAALPAGTHERTRILWRVTDPAAVPREFLCVDAARVGAVVAQQGLHTSIPGIEAYEDKTLVTRGAS